MATTSMPVLALVRNLLTEDHPDKLREMLHRFVDLLMSVQVDGLCGAAYGEVPTGSTPAMAIATGPGTPASAASTSGSPSSAAAATSPTLPSTPAAGPSAPSSPSSPRPT